MLLKITSDQFNELMEGGEGDACSIQYLFDTEWHNRVDISGEPEETKSMALGIALHNLVLDSDIEYAHDYLDEEDEPEPETIVEVADIIVSDLVGKKSEHNNNEVDAAKLIDKHIKSTRQVLEEAVDPEKNQTSSNSVTRGAGQIIDFPATPYAPTKGQQLLKIYRLAIQCIQQHGRPLDRTVLTKAIGKLSGISKNSISPKISELIQGCHLIDVSQE